MTANQLSLPLMSMSVIRRRLTVTMIGKIASCAAMKAALGSSDPMGAVRNVASRIQAEVGVDAGIERHCFKTADSF
jgi:hypothetical protein